MFEALVITLREGIEAALMVGIIVAFLRRQGSERYLSAVWSGLVAAVAASLAGAFVLYRVAVNEEVFEGLLYVGSALLVATLLIWMWRHSHALAGEMKGSLARILDRESSGSIRFGLFLFTFVMVFREGLETVLFLSAVSLTTTGLQSFLGALIGIAAAAAFGVLFVRGSLRIDLKRFFAVTGIALLIFTLQLLINGYHELSEAGWVPANETTMATVGPLVKNEFFFLAAVLALPLLMLLIPGSKSKAPAAATPAPNDAAAYPPTGADRRLERAAEQRQVRARRLAGALGLAILAVLGLGWVYSAKPKALSAATPVEVVGGRVTIPLGDLADSKLHRYRVEIGGRSIRFIAIQVAPGEVAAAFDACLICGPHGYYQEGSNIVCLHCGSAVYPPTIGQPGGCNPIPLATKSVGGSLVITASDLAASSAFPATAGGMPGMSSLPGNPSHAGHGG
ncbi:MAG TPA: Fe-S-containing protein [Thermoanaerobaculia bacterium]|nr:Fe-S-containing protein [Thermoanaerobaculia bacterium]